MIRDKLKELRRKSGLSQAELAKTLGIPQTTYSNYETGRGSPPLPTLKKLAEFYGVTADSILGEIGEEEQRIAAQIQALPPKEREAVKTILDVLTTRTNGGGGGTN